MTSSVVLHFRTTKHSSHAPEDEDVERGGDAKLQSKSSLCLENLRDGLCPQPGGGTARSNPVLRVERSLRFCLFARQSALICLLSLGITSHLPFAVHTLVLCFISASESGVKGLKS